MAKLRSQAFQPCPSSSTSPPRRGQLSTAVKASVGRLVCDHMPHGWWSVQSRSGTPRLSMGGRDESIQGLHPASTGVMRVTNAAEGGWDCLGGTLMITNE